jgi:hypothetical protein
VKVARVDRRATIPTRTTADRRRDLFKNLGRRNETAASRIEPSVHELNGTDARGSKV